MEGFVEEVAPRSLSSPGGLGPGVAARRQSQLQPSGNTGGASPGAAGMRPGPARVCVGSGPRPP